MVVVEIDGYVSREFADGRVEIEGRDGWCHIFLQEEVRRMESLLEQPDLLAALLQKNGA